MTEDNKISKDAKAMMVFETSKKSLLLSYLFWFFLGGFGAHRFYLGRTKSAVIMLVIGLISGVTLFIGIGVIGFSVIGIWALIDAFLMPGMVRSYNTDLINRLS